MAEAVRGFHYAQIAQAHPLKACFGKRQVHSGENLVALEGGKMQSPASPATRAFAVHDYNLSFHEGSRHRLKRHGVQQLGPEILPLKASRN